MEALGTVEVEAVDEVALEGHIGHIHQGLQSVDMQVPQTDW